MRQLQPVWYSLTPNDAVNRLSENQSVKREIESEKEPVFGKLGHAYLTESMLKFYLISSDGKEGQIRILMRHLIFRTNDQKIEIIEPGVQCFTITL